MENSLITIPLHSSYHQFHGQETWWFWLESMPARLCSFTRNSIIDLFHQQAFQFYCSHHLKWNLMQVSELRLLKLNLKVILLTNRFLSQVQEFHVQVSLACLLILSYLSVIKSQVLWFSKSFGLCYFLDDYQVLKILQLRDLKMCLCQFSSNLFPLLFFKYFPPNFKFLVKMERDRSSCSIDHLQIM